MARVFVNKRRGTAYETLWYYPDNEGKTTITPRGNLTIGGTDTAGFCKLLMQSDCKLISVPYTDTLEKKSELLKEYIR